MKNEDGFDFLEFPCKSGKPDALIIFLHGHSNHPDMFAELPARIQKEWPGADVLLVRGPIATHADQGHKDRVGASKSEDLYTWHKVENKPESTLELTLTHLFNRVPVVDQLNKFADAQLAKRGLKDDNLVLYGFSLGGAIVMQMATKRDDKCAALICHSAPVFPIIAPKSKPDTLLVMGDQDYFFYLTSKTVKEAPPAKPEKKGDKMKGRIKQAFDKALNRISVHYDNSLKRIKRAGLPVTGIVVKGLDHSINEESFNHTIGFITDHLKKK